MLNDRKKRLSDALKQNLLKRKQQQRDRKSQNDDAMDNQRDLRQSEQLSKVEKKDE